MTCLPHILAPSTFGPCRREGCCEDDERTTTVTLVAGQVVVADTSIEAESVISVAMLTPGGTPGVSACSSKTPGVGYTITSTSGTDTSVLVVTISE